VAPRRISPCSKIFFIRRAWWAQTPAKKSAWSWEVAVGDVNKDGLPDLFVVNLGIDRTAPPEKMMKSRFAEVWLNTSQKKRP
jgi:hypothetical protein